MPVSSQSPRSDLARPLLPYLLAIALLALTASLLWPAMTLSAKRQKSVITPDKQFDYEALVFEMQVDRRAPGCQSIAVAQTKGINVSYYYCPPTAMASFTEASQISNQFPISKPLAPRVSFWRRIYAEWSIHEYVLHSSLYPEVALEVANTQNLLATHGPDARNELVKAVLNGRRDYYRREFLKLSQIRQISYERLTPVQKRLVDATAHINDPQKFRKIADTFRIQRGQRDFVIAGISRAAAYWPTIDQVFREQGIPVELSRIALVESSFNLQAYSKVGAAGPYQLMPATGRQYLHIGDHWDERRDPIKAARAAARLFKLYYKVLGSWPLTITAYNHGVGGINRAMRATGHRDIESLIARYDGKGFGFASKNFYAEFLAMLQVVGDHVRYFPDVTVAPALTFKTVRLPTTMSFREMTRKYRVGIDAVLALNPDIHPRIFRANGTLPRGYEVKIGASEAKTQVANVP